MGPVRRGLILAIAPLPAWAEVCDKQRPDWDGIPVSAWAEAARLFGSPVSLVLLLATAVALRFRSQWGALGVCVAWTGWVSLIAFLDPTGGVRAAAMAEGCMGPSTGFIVAVAILCIGTILYTSPRPPKT